MSTRTNYASASMVFALAGGLLVLGSQIGSSVAAATDDSGPKDSLSSHCADADGSSSCQMRQSDNSSRNPGDPITAYSTATWAQRSAAITPPDCAYPANPEGESPRIAHVDRGYEYEHSDQLGTYMVKTSSARASRHASDNSEKIQMPDDSAIAASADRAETPPERDGQIAANDTRKFYPVTLAPSEADSRAAAMKDQSPQTSASAAAPITSASALPLGVDQLTADWPQEQKNAIAAMTVKYGQPAEATRSMVLWRDNAPYAYTRICKESIGHDFPGHHSDFLEQGIAYKVPADKLNDLAEFDGSVMVDRTRGMLISRCDTEEHNTLALNLAHEIITGSKSADEARLQLSQLAMAFKNGDKDGYSEKLNFEPQKDAGDPDHPLDTRASTDGR